MPAITAAQILAENGWNVDDHISKANLEYLIDNAINFINLETGLSISNLSGTSPNKTVTVTNAQDVVVKSLVALCVRGYLEKGPQVGVGGATVAMVLSDPHYKIQSAFVWRGINRLRGRSFKRT